MEKDKKTEKVEKTEKNEKIQKEDNITENKIKIKDNKAILIVGIVALLIIALVIYKIVFNNPDDIKKVKRVLKEKYEDVSCINSSCNGFVVTEGDKLKEVKVILLNDEGKKVASYKEKYKSDSKTENKPYQLSDDYFIVITTNKKDSSIKSYSIYGKSGKVTYTTENKLQVLNDKYIIMTEKDNGSEMYSIIDKDGKKIYSSIKEYETYAEGSVISLQIDADTILLDQSANKLLSGYSVKKEIFDEDGNVAYLIVKDIKNSVYNYYSLKNKEIIGDSFESYVQEVGTTNLIITKTETSKKVKYRLNIKGKQEKIENDFVQVDEVSRIKSKINSSDYYLYTISVIKNNQKSVLVDNLKSNSIGILDIDNNKYEEIYKYSNNKTNVYSTVTKLNSDNDNMYLQLSCSSSVCENQMLVVYDFNNKKMLYSLKGKDLIAQYYTAYENDYKVIRYSYSSSNADYKGKYVLYDKDNKELLKSTSEIVVIDKKVLFGKTGSSSLVLYSAKDKKQLNSENSSASIITVSNEKLYKYTNDNSETVITNLKGKKILVAPKDLYLKYSNDMIIYIDDNYVKMYDVKTNISKKYKLKKNEKINDILGDMIPPYRGSIFVNNSIDKKVKVLNSNSNVIKTIKNAEISSVGLMENGDVYIITKTINKKGNQYGLYIAK